MKMNLAKFYNDPDWVIVEDILKECYSSLKYSPDESLAPADFKAQVLANKKLKDAVDKFLSQAQVLSNSNTSDNPWE